MRLTKLGHACVRLEKDGVTMVVDRLQIICAEEGHDGYRVKVRSKECEHHAERQRPE